MSKEQDRLRAKKYRDAKRDADPEIVTVGTVTHPETSRTSVTPSAADYARDYPGMTPEAIAQEEAHWRKVNESGVLTDEDMAKLLKWGVRTGQIRMTSPEMAKMVIGPDDEAIDKVMALVNGKYGAGSLVRLGVGEGMTGQAFNYSHDWYGKR